MARPVEQAVAAVVCTFQEHAGRGEHKLCQAELQELLQKELLQEELLQEELPAWTRGSAGARCGEAAAGRRGGEAAAGTRAALHGGTATGSEQRTAEGARPARGEGPLITPAALQGAGTQQQQWAPDQWSEEESRGAAAPRWAQQG